MKKVIVEVLLLLIFATCSCSVTQDPQPELSEPLPSPTTSQLAQSATSAPTQKPPELERLEDVWDMAAARPGADIGEVFQLFRLKQSLGPRNLACYDETSGEVCEKIVEAINIVGLRLLESGEILEISVQVLTVELTVRIKFLVFHWRENPSIFFTCLKSGVTLYNRCIPCLGSCSGSLEVTGPFSWLSQEWFLVRTSSIGLFLGGVALAGLQDVIIIIKELIQII